MGVKKVSLVGKSPKVGKRDAAGGISKMGKRNFFAKTHAVSHLTPRGTREKLENQLFSPKIAQNTEIPFPCRWAMCNTLTSHPLSIVLTRSKLLTPRPNTMPLVKYQSSLQSQSLIPLRLPNHIYPKEIKR